ncbi:MAG TPA: hypothetical protein VF503_00840 [Sphingobium sp.]|uniref:hypothetical protein n=1 Tax=Sphingobium sp. TaxID=1912891 RepID=UPI002ED10E0C
MGNSKLLISAAAVVVLGFATPSFADSTSAGATVTGAKGDHSDTNVSNTNKTLVFAPSETTSITKKTSLDVKLSNSSERNGNVKIVADQQLGQSISNESRMNFDGKRSDYGSGSNSVSGSAFAAYSGILNQAWNTGISSNTQSATNIAAQGQTSFTTH